MKKKEYCGCKKRHILFAGWEHGGWRWNMLMAVIWCREEYISDLKTAWYGMNWRCENCQHTYPTEVPTTLPLDVRPTVSCLWWQRNVGYISLKWRDHQGDCPGPLFAKKTPSYQYRDSHYKPETVVRPSQVYNGDSYTRKTASSYWIEAQVLQSPWAGTLMTFPYLCLWGYRLIYVYSLWSVFQLCHYLFSVINITLFWTYQKGTVAGKLVMMEITEWMLKKISSN